MTVLASVPVPVRFRALMPRPVAVMVPPMVEPVPRVTVFRLAATSAKAMLPVIAPVLVRVWLPMPYWMLPAMRPALVVVLLRRFAVVAFCGSASVKRTSPLMIPVAALVRTPLPAP